LVSAVGIEPTTY